LPYRLTRQAEDDIIRVYREGMRLFGSAQAERYHRELQGMFELLARFPGMAREREEIRPPVRIHPHKAHLIVYVVEPDGSVLVLRLRHGREDWIND
jgi:toxin ParE1/3/4